MDQVTIADTVQNEAPHVTKPPSLLKLPDELLLQIALCLRGHMSQPDPQRDMRSLAATCQQLTTVARDALFHAPILRSSKVDLFLDLLFAYPTLRNKIKSLTIETKEARGQEILPQTISGLKSHLLLDCIYEVEQLPIALETKEWWVADLQVTRFPTHGTLLTLLLAMLPCMKELYLGGSMLLNFPLFRDLLPTLDDKEYLEDLGSVGVYSNWDNPNLTCITAMLGYKLTVLELPNHFRLITETPWWFSEDVQSISQYFPNLQWLSLPFEAVEQDEDCRTILPYTLQELVFTDGEGSTSWLLQVCRLKPTHFPSLRRISVYYRIRDSASKVTLFESLDAVEVEYFEHMPECCLRSGDAFFHPWCYTAAELKVSMAATHEAYFQEIQAEVAKRKISAERRQARLVNKGLQAIRHLFANNTE
jgi:hypothetical protein